MLGLFWKISLLDRVHGREAIDGHVSKVAAGFKNAPPYLVSLCFLIMENRAFLDSFFEEF